MPLNTEHQQEGGDKTRMVGLTDGVETRCKVKLS